jgi:hypothetical protein
MDDVPEGGGAPSAAIIPDASTNSIFPDISELDRAGGRVNLRKVFAKVRTADTEGYFGVNVIVADPFEDPRVSATLFTTGDVFDRRSEAAARMESYLARGATYSGLLFGDHLAGQMVVVLLQRNEVPLPVTGQTLVLTKNQGQANEFSQFLRITSVAATTRTFTDGTGDFQRTQVVCDISDQLQQDFPGASATRFDSSVNFATLTRVSETVVADAARYYGVVPLTGPVAIGDFTVQASNIYTQLVPSTRIEVPIGDARMNQQAGALVPAAAGPFTRLLPRSWVAGSAMFVGGGILPGSFSASLGGITVTDKGGTLIDVIGDQVGTIDYENGVATLSVSVFGSSGSGTYSVTYTPAAAPTLVSESFGVPVTAESQRLNWALSLDPPPARGSLQVSYRAGGNWYVLKDDGSGALRGSSSSVGAGSLNFSTGTITVTLGALPDVGSSLVLTSQPAAVSLPMSRVDETAPALPRRFGKVMTLGRAIKPGTLTLTWTGGTATDAGGLLTGDATGVVNYAEGIVDFRPNTLPAVGTNIAVALTETSKTVVNIPSMTDAGTTWTGSLPPNQKAGSVEMAVVGGIPTAKYADNSINYRRVSLRVTDNGAGSLRTTGATGPVTVGTINYTTGAFTLEKTIAAGYSVVWYVSRPWFVLPDPGSTPVVRNDPPQTTPASLTIFNGPGGEQPPVPEWAWWTGSQGNAVEARASGADLPTFSGSVTLDNIFLPANAAGYGATTQFSTEILNFDMGGNFYAKSGNAYVLSPDPSTGLGTVVGSASVVAGMSGVLLTAWPLVSSLVTRVAGASQPPLGLGTPLTTSSVTFRTAVSPLVSSGFQVAGAFAVSGATFTATANASGVVSTGSAVVGVTPGSYGVFGRVDFEQGLATLHFGRRVPVSMATDAGVIDLSSMSLPGVQYVQVYPVRADSLRYNATGYSYLPLDPGILGLNPVRLPADGRVPIFRPGSFAVLGHTGTVGPATVNNGTVVNCARTRLSRVRVIDDDGNVIDTGYTADLDAGTVTFTNVTGYSQPVTVEHRIEDTMLVSNAQISGQLTFTRPSTHVYPVPGSYVSSALVAGDVRARVQPAFDQSTWTNVWSDAQIGNAATGTFNDTQSPITTSNLGALTERWAVIFTNSTAFNVIGEHVGVIATGSTGSNCAPLNPSTGAPYFNIPAAGWGLGWSTGNVLRFNTIGAEVPIWVARTILQGPETVEDDEFTILIRGDVNRP